MAWFKKNKKESDIILWNYFDFTEEKEKKTIITLLDDVFKWHNRMETDIKKQNIDSLIEKLREFKNVKRPEPPKTRIVNNTVKPLETK